MIQSFIKCINLVEDEESVRSRVELGGGSVIEDGAVVRGLVSIGQDNVARSKGYLGPYTSIGDDCVIEGVHIESSVVGESEITAERTVVDSPIGREATITNNGDKKTEGEHLVVGRHSSRSPSCSLCGTVVAGNVLEDHRELKCPGLNCDEAVRSSDLPYRKGPHILDNPEQYAMED